MVSYQTWPVDESLAFLKESQLRIWNQQRIWFVCQTTQQATFVCSQVVLTPFSIYLHYITPQQNWLSHLLYETRLSSSVNPTTLLAMRRWVGVWISSGKSFGRLREKAITALLHANTDSLAFSFFSLLASNSFILPLTSCRLGWIAALIMLQPQALGPNSAPRPHGLFLGLELLFMYSILYLAP